MQPPMHACCVRGQVNNRNSMRLRRTSAKSCSIESHDIYPQPLFTHPRRPHTYVPSQLAPSLSPTNPKDIQLLLNLENGPTTITTEPIIHAPSPTKQQHPKSVFLAGTTSLVDANARDWRETLSASLADVPVTIYNPYRSDWDASWREDASFAPYREQVEWELEKLE